MISGIMRWMEHAEPSGAVRNAYVISVGKSEGDNA
jgi:hypothetical protein